MNIVEDSPQAKAVAPAPPAELIAWLEAIFSGLMRSVGTCQVALGPRAWPIYLRLQRARNRIVALLTKLATLIAAGKTPRAPTRRIRPTPATRAPTPRIRPKPAAHTPRPTIPPEQRMPRGRAWLSGALDYHGRGHAHYLTVIFGNPEWVAAIAQSPGVVRTLRAYCHVLGIDLPEALRLPPRPRKPRPPKPARPRRGASHMLPGDRPLPKYVLAAARAWKRRDEDRAKAASAHSPKIP